MLLLTGGSGHVGGRIIDLATRNNIDTVAVYRGDSTPAWATTKRSCVKWVRCDINDPAGVSQLGDRYGITSCIHAAAVSNEARAHPDPLGTVTANVGSTATLLDTARTQAWRRFVLVSTGSVFQKRALTGAPIPEDAVPEPENVYSSTKVAAEMLCRMYRTEYGLSASTVRISWVFGPPVTTQDATRGPIPSFAIRALRGETIREGGADFAASFTFIEDVAKGLLALDSAATLNSPVYHLGHGINFKLSEVAEAICKMIPGSEIELEPGTEPWTRYTAIRDPLGSEKMNVDTGFQAAYSLEQGIAAYVEWLRERPELWAE